MNNEPLRPDPDRLLEQTAAPHRGKLKVFFGACAGVGKTWAMLAEAQRLRTQGLDIVVGVVETHGRKDTAAMLGRFGLSALVLRGFNDAELEDFASYSDIPVVNGISDTSHPLQVLSDLFTVWEKKGRLQNLKLAYIGDGNNVANSLIIGCTKCDMNIAIASPNGYSPARSIVERGMQYGDILITDSVAEAVKSPHHTCAESPSPSQTSSGR